ncbi:regulatory protein RecX [Lachnospiraceae bacterium MD1]|uniref:Regulatory protein RecX n=1 Tax=Variimorphobacter saccharofermentans TaxID=2755051 RepID=A0A839K038_9FIRM|nr:regulatory protein RecX [Variimorphobacter saccharofermentans]MBB2183020.1 regulatory protein RecX [Variimorphobacter saccharofermentans]
MLVTSLKELKKNKIQVYLDEEYTFLLDQKEINKYHINENMIMTKELYKELEELMYAKAKSKALSLLYFSDRSDTELRNKLREYGFNDSMIDRTMTYLYEYGYVDDERMASAYIRSRMHTKSKYYIQRELQQKGIRDDIIEELLTREYDNETNEDAELIAISKAIKKKTKAPEELSYEEKQKLIASLFRKGFSIDKIKRVLT